MDKAVDAGITEGSTNDNVEDVVESPEDEPTDVAATVAAETFINTSPESDASKQTKAVDHKIDLTEADKLLKQHDREAEELMEDAMQYTQ